MIPLSHNRNSKRKQDLILFSHMQWSPSQQQLGHIHTSTQVADWQKTRFRDLCFVWSEAFVELINCLHMSLESNCLANITTRTVSHPNATGLQEGWHTTRATCQTKHMLSNSSTTLLHSTLYPFLDGSR